MENSFIDQIGKLITSTCPICHSPLKRKKREAYHLKMCSEPNHFLFLLLDKKTKRPFSLKISLNDDYSHYFIIDFIQNHAKIKLTHHGVHREFILPQIPQLIFPNLLNIKQIASTLEHF